MDLKREEWIAIADRLPDDGLICLVSDGIDFNIGLAIADRSGATGPLYWDPCGCGGIDFEWTFEPTHWVPLNASLPNAV